MDINEKIVQSALLMYGDHTTIGSVRDALAEMIANTINADCPCDETCPCWLDGYENGLEMPREPSGY